MSNVAAKPTGLTMKGEPRKRATRLTKSDIPQLRAIIDSLPLATYSSLARELGRDDTAVRAFCVKHGIIVANSRHQPVRATGVQGAIFAEIDRQNIPLKKVAKELQLHQATIGHYRTGRCNVSAFTLECLAEIAGYRLVLAPLSEVSSQDGQQ